MAFRLSDKRTEEIRQLIKNLIEREYRQALDEGLLDSAEVSNKIWNVLLDKNALHIPVPESACGCFENFDE